jgi:hypothetical protein
VVLITSRLGYRIPFFKAGIALRRHGNKCARYAKNTHQKDTKANWTSVKVIGFGNMLRIDLEEVFVRAELMYQMMHRP